MKIENIDTSSNREIEVKVYLYSNKLLDKINRDDLAGNWEPCVYTWDSYSGLYWEWKKI